MEKEDIKLSDINRILFGETPPEFLIEVFFRTLFMYIVLQMVVRWLGKRMNGQLTITEMAIMLTLGAIVAVPMQAPDRGLLQGILILSCSLLFHRGMNLLGVQHASIERLTQGTLSILVKEGVMQLDEMKKCSISRQQLFAVIRAKEIYQLGEVERVYLEACGLFSIYKTPASKPGLSVLPPSDPSIQIIQKKSNGNKACCSCGLTVQTNETSCHFCHERKWVQAVQ